MSYAICNPIYHPSESFLLDYAAGSAPEPIGLLVASHLTLCPACRREVEQLERLGGALLEELHPEPVGQHALAHLFARIEQGEAEQAPEPRPRHENVPASDLPRPLLDYVGTSLDDPSWRRFGPIAEVKLLKDFGDFTTRLLRVEAGKAIPSHIHSGRELTLVLRGGFSDLNGRYRRGDVAQEEPQTAHRPLADEGEDCLCLVVTDAPLRLTGFLGRLLHPFFRI